MRVSLTPKVKQKSAEKPCKCLNIKEKWRGGCLAFSPCHIYTFPQFQIRIFNTLLQKKLRTPQPLHQHHNQPFHISFTKMSKNPTTLRNAPNSAFLTLALTTAHLAQENAPTGFLMALNRVLHRHTPSGKITRHSKLFFEGLRWSTQILILPHKTSPRTTHKFSPTPILKSDFPQV